MTSDDALEWLQRRSVVVILHEERIVLVLPNKSLDVSHAKNVFTVSCRDGFTIAQSEKGDTLVEVVDAAKRCWRENISVIDAIADSSPTYKHDPVKIHLSSDKDGFWE